MAEVSIGQQNTHGFGQRFSLGFDCSLRAWLLQRQMDCGSIFLRIISSTSSGNADKLGLSHHSSRALLGGGSERGEDKITVWEVGEVIEKYQNG